MRNLVLFAVLFGAWLLMSGHYNPLLIGLGIASCALATFLADRIGATDSEGLPLHLMFGLPLYLVWLLWEIVKSNLTTGWLILGGRVQPVVFETRASQKTSSGVVTYANSITLTPGTVTIQVYEGAGEGGGDDCGNGNSGQGDVDGGAEGGGENQRESRLLVHALVPAFRSDIESGAMDRKVAALEAGRLL